MTYRRRRRPTGKNADCFVTDQKSERAATRLLRQNGCTWSGRPRGSVDPAQKDFEKDSFISTPCGGQPPN